MAHKESGRAAIGSKFTAKTKARLKIAGLYCSINICSNHQRAFNQTEVMKKQNSSDKKNFTYSILSFCGRFFTC